MTTTLIVWGIIYLIVFLLRKHLDFGVKQGWPYHWIICKSIPILFWIVGALSGWMTSTQILFFGFITSVLLAVGKELYDKYRKGGSGFSGPDLLVGLSAAFCGTFFFVLPIINS